MRLPGDYFGLKSRIKAEKDVIDYLIKKIDEHRVRFNESGGRVDDFIDSFLSEKKRREEAAEQQEGAVYDGTATTITVMT